jgi:hypothetical protein
MAILVLDASVIFDLERGELLEATFKLEDVFVTPDLLYQTELEDDVGPRLRELGLQIVELNEEEVATAQQIAREDGKLSRADCWALTSAMRPEHRLLSGDARVRARAEVIAIPCSGLLWMLDRIYDTATITPVALIDGLSRITKHRRARLPKAEVEERLARWRKEAGRFEAREQMRTPYGPEASCGSPRAS